MWTAPGGRVIAFEPNPTARTVLDANVRLNGFQPSVTIRSRGVCPNAPGTAALFHGQETSGMSRLGSPNQDRGPARQWRWKSAHSTPTAASHHVTPAWVLIDTEGHELQVLEGAKSLLANQRVGFVIEMHPTLWPDGEATAQAFDALVRANGRTAIPLHRPARPDPRLRPRSLFPARLS